VSEPSNSAEPEQMPDLSDQMQVRLEKRAALLAEGRPAYPVAVGRTHSLTQVRDQWGHLETGEETLDVVGITGRVVFVRNTGKLCFATLQEGDGTRLQAMLSLAEVGEEALAEWKHLVDLGDHVFIEGRVISSRRGELSVLAARWDMVSKALRPLPVLHKDLSEESRVRHRYADLIVRQEARDMVRTKAAVLRSIRSTLDGFGFIEVETPVLQLVHGGAAARPFQTHLNAFSQDMTLRIALELYLKRAVVGGVDRVYEIGRIFRNEGVDSTHSPEFTMLEYYEAYGDQFSAADRMRSIILDAAEAVGAGSTVSDARGREIDLAGEWRWLPIVDGVAEALGEQITAEETPENAELLRALADKRDIPVKPTWGAGQIILELFEHLVERDLVQPTFVCDYPESVRPLARAHRSKPDLVEAWDLIIGGVERGVSYSELVDPVIQRERLVEQSLLAAAGDPEAMQLDEDFLEALEYGAPPMGGSGLGVDRLVMLLTGVGIRETILFPHLRPRA
jgi:lysyl-tRNA synthetase class 2